MPSAVVVGSGPNGLAAAITLARAGVDVEVIEAEDTIGGGTRSAELTVPGLVHDVCSAFHPTAQASQFFRELGPDLERHGLRWRWPEIQLAHPFDDGPPAVMHRSVDDTAAGLGVDGGAWRRLFAPLADHADDLVADIFRPIIHVPRHPLRLASFGVRAVLPASVLARRWHAQQARALFGGIAAHAMYPLTRPMSSSVGLVLGAAGHAWGWPVAEGGSQAIADAMAGMLAELGGVITTGRRVERLDGLDGVDADIVMLDVSPRAAADLLGDRQPRLLARRYHRYRYGPAAFKVDLAVEGGVPWRDDACHRAGTVHLGGTLEEIVAGEAEIHRGRMPERPFVLVGQQYLCDPARSVGDMHPVWAYAHVPAAYAGDATEAVIAQIERFAPGVRDRIRGVSTRTPADLAAHNANYVGGDIATGANDPLQTVFRPGVGAHPYRTGVDGVYLCSSATPPGAGVHGMCGCNAARDALRTLR